jgi:hypothetical protein
MFPSLLIPFFNMTFSFHSSFPAKKKDVAEHLTKPVLAEVPNDICDSTQAAQPNLSVHRRPETGWSPGFIGNKTSSSWPAAAKTGWQQHEPPRTGPPAPANSCSGRRDSPSEKQGHQKEDEKHDEQDFGDPHRCAFQAPEAEKAGYQSDDEKHDCIPQHGLILPGS